MIPESSFLTVLHATEKYSKQYTTLSQEVEEKFEI